MITGKTKSGFDYSIGEEALNDYELLDALAELDGGNMLKITFVAKHLLGDKQHDDLKNHVREGGRVPADKMIAEVTEILTASQNGKN